MKKHFKSAELKAQRRIDSETRNAAWAALTPRQQLQSLDNRGLRAVKQRAKIAGSMEK